MQAIARTLLQCALALGLQSAQADSTLFEYNPSLGSLPELQGFTAEASNTPPAASTVNGVLHQFPQLGSRGRQYWITGIQYFDLANTSYLVELDLQVVNSQFLASTPDGPRFGYYFGITDLSGKGYIVGISSSGVALTTNVDVYNNLSAIDTTNTFHHYALLSRPGSASLYVDGALLQTVAFGGSGFAAGSAFGDVTFYGASETYLQHFAISAVPDLPSPLGFFFGIAPILLLAKRRVRAGAA